MRGSSRGKDTAVDKVATKREAATEAEGFAGCSPRQCGPLLHPLSHAPVQPVPPLQASLLEEGGGGRGGEGALPLPLRHAVGIDMNCVSIAHK